MAKQSFRDLISSMDRAAETSGDAKIWWSAVALVLVVWSAGGIPAPRFDYRIHDGLKPLAAAYKRFGSELRSVADARAFAA